MDSRLALPTNTVLDGSYRIARVLGSDGFAVTYAAEDIKLGTMVAIKEYYPSDFGDRDSAMSVRPRSERNKTAFERGRSNFLHEARTLAGFVHPSIVRVTRVFEANGTAYMVMRFEQGMSLDRWLSELGRSPTQKELDAILHPLLDALRTLHAANFLHRDIAPDNIIIRPDGTPVLLDFGAARRAVAEMDRSLSGIAKAGYSPHEQYAADARLQGPWTDIYSLGGTLYRAVTGERPDEVMLRVHQDHMASAVQLAKNRYRRDFLDAIDWSLRIRAQDRPQSVSEWQGALLADASAPAGTSWRPPSRSGQPGNALALHDMRQWSEVMTAAKAGTLVAERPSPKQGRVGAAPRERRMEAFPPEYSRGSPPLEARLLPRRGSAIAIGAICAVLGLTLLSRTVRDTLGQLLAVLGLKLNAMPAPGALQGVQRDLVDCSVFSPPAAPPGSTLLVQVFLHVRADKDRVSALASVMDAAATLKGVQTLQAEIPRGAQVDISISGAGLEIEEPTQSLVWRGEPAFVQFLVTLPTAAGTRSYHPIVRVALDGRLVGRIIFRIDANLAASRVVSCPRGDRAGPYTYAFVSYASEDRAEVLKRVQVLDATRMEFFQDVLSLDPGARWEKELYKRIDDCDLFLLFWSSAAKRSEWVIREAEYALARQGAEGGGEPDIVPIILEGPPPVSAPDTLRHLHFNDRIRYFIAAG